MPGSESWQASRVGKKSREKKARRGDAPNTGEALNGKAAALTGGSEKGLYQRLEEAGVGDLRLVAQHVEGFLNGVREAEEALLLMGRDAAALVLAEADKRKSEPLSELGRKLAALRPRVDTNLHELRAESVGRLCELAQKNAPKLSSSPVITVRSPAVALFDPVRVVDALARTGRPRNDVARVTAGDIAWAGLGGKESYAVRLTADAPADAAGALELRLVVESGAVFVGPPEAADGARLGTVRLDPYRTGLDDHLERGAFVGVAAGAYRVLLLKSDGGVTLHLSPVAADAPFAPDVARMGQLNAD